MYITITFKSCIYLIKVLSVARCIRLDRLSLSNNKTKPKCTWDELSGLWLRSVWAGGILTNTNCFSLHCFFYIAKLFRN